MDEPEQRREEEQIGEPTWGRKVVALHDRLARSGLPYAFGGAIALNYHREPRSTLDVDINVFIPAERHQEVLIVLGGLFALPDREQVELRLANDAQARTRWENTYVDLFLANTDFHASMAERIERKPFDGAEIPVLSIEDLLICKVLYNRPKDWLDVSAVVAAEGPLINRAYIESWLSYFLGPDSEPAQLMAQELSGRPKDS